MSEDKTKVLSPREFTGDNNGDWGYMINGVKSEKSYATKSGASNGLDREIKRRQENLKSAK